MKYIFKNHLVPPTLTVLAECRDIFQSQFDLLKILADDVLSAASWSAAKSPPVNRQRGKLIDDSGGMVISSSQDVTKPANSVLSDGAKDVWLIIEMQKAIIFFLHEKFTNTLKSPEYHVTTVRGWRYTVADELPTETDALGERANDLHPK